MRFSGTTYIPESIRKELGVRDGGTVPFLLGGKVVLFFQKGTEIRDILLSLQALVLKALSRIKVPPEEKEKLMREWREGR